jgi:hypothetical protein
VEIFFHLPAVLFPFFVIAKWHVARFEAATIQRKLVLEILE